MLYKLLGLRVHCSLYPQRELNLTFFIKDKNINCLLGHTDLPHSYPVLLCLLLRTRTKRPFWVRAASEVKPFLLACTSIKRAETFSLFFSFFCYPFASRSFLWVMITTKDLKFHLFLFFRVHPLMISFNFESFLIPLPFCYSKMTFLPRPSYLARQEW